jgi:hypothetical protein
MNSYLVYSLIFLLIWAILFIVMIRRDLHRAMLLVSFVVTPMGPLSELWYLQDYWQRETFTGYPISIEDALFAFAVGGITFALYKAIFKCGISKSPEFPRRDWLVPFFGFLILGLLVTLTNVLYINSIFSSSLAFFIFALIVWMLRPDLILPSIATGFLSAALFLGVYQLMMIIYPDLLLEWCKACNPTGMRLLGVNIEELLWDFSWGLVGGILYEAVTGRRFCRYRQQLGKPVYEYEFH